MAKLSKEVLDAIIQAADGIEYGEIVIHLVEHSNAVDIEVNERLRFVKSEPPRAGQVVNAKRVVRLDQNPV